MVVTNQANNRPKNHKLKRYLSIYPSISTNYLTNASDIINLQGRKRPLDTPKRYREECAPTLNRVKFRLMCAHSKQSVDQE